jgi:hypothetical protein
MMSVFGKGGKFGFQIEDFRLQIERPTLSHKTREGWGNLAEIKIHNLTSAVLYFS